MIQIRNKIEEWVEWPEGYPINKRSEPVLQYRFQENFLELGLQEPIWSEWQDVKTVYVEGD